MNLFKLKVIVFFFVLFGIFACNNSDDDGIIICNCGGNINRAFLTLSEPNTEDAVIFSLYSDDETGNFLSTKEEGFLKSNTTYSGNLVFQNELKDYTEDITAEIISEKEEFQVFYEITGFTMDFEYNDMDDDGYPIGLNITVITGASGVGKITITLRHQPDKGAQGVAMGEIANAGGETDIEMMIPIVIQ